MKSPCFYAKQESLGFSPFELVYGHTVRGPLKLLKDRWLLGEDNESGLLDYVAKFKERLVQTWELARENLKISQDKMKTWYDKRSKARTFKPGDKVLVLLPIPGQPLRAKYFGPFDIEKKVNDLNYIVKTPGRRKSKQLCHINMIKQYYDRSGVDHPNVESVATTGTEVTNLDKDSHSHGYDQSTLRLKNSDVLSDLGCKLSHLPDNEQKELMSLIQEFSYLFKDVPTKTTRICHDVDVGDVSPIKQHPYRMNPLKQEFCRTELAYMLEHDIIEHSNSPWSSPCLLVPKPDGSFRFCTDFRKVNALTKTDSYPIPRIEDCIDK